MYLRQVNEKQNHVSMDKSHLRPVLKMSSNPYVREELDSNGTSPPQSPGAESQKSFSSTTPIYDARRGTVTSRALGFQSSEQLHFKMRTWESKKIRRLSAFLVFFIIVAVVMSALFVWRETVSGRNSEQTNTGREVSRLSFKLSYFYLEEYKVQIKVNMK